MSEDWYTVQFEVQSSKSCHTVYFKMRNTQTAGKMMNAFNERNRASYNNFVVDGYTIQPNDIVGNLNIMNKIVYVS